MLAKEKHCEQLSLLNPILNVAIVNPDLALSWRNKTFDPERSSIHHVRRRQLFCFLQGICDAGGFLVDIDHVAHYDLRILVRYDSRGRKTASVQIRIHLNLTNRIFSAVRKHSGRKSVELNRGVRRAVLWELYLARESAQLGA